MAAAAHGDDQPVLPSEGEGGDHVRHAGAAGDHGRPTVDIAVPDRACLLVAGIVGG
jgi:hypothetical protein